MTDATKESVAAFMAEKGLAIRSEFVPWSQSRNKNEKDDSGRERRSLNWRVALLHGGRDILTTDYSAGIVHCPAYARTRKTSGLTVLQYEEIRWETENGRTWTCLGGKRGHILPDAADVFHSLMIDVGVLEAGDFESWASEFGYDPDSREAEKTYKACVAIALKLRAGLGPELLQACISAVEGY